MFVLAVKTIYGWQCHLILGLGNLKDTYDFGSYSSKEHALNFFRAPWNEIVSEILLTSNVIIYVKGNNPCITI